MTPVTPVTVRSRAQILAWHAVLCACLIAGVLGVLLLRGRDASAAARAATPAWTSGVSPMPGTADVPIAWMPPGASASPEPSEEIFPPQSITIRFNHKKHVKELSLSCKVCHAAAFASLASSDRLFPRPTETCDNCHEVDHANPANVHLTSSLAAGSAAKAPSGQCAFCHTGYKPADGNHVPVLALPRANMVFNHKKHLDRNIQCAQCHGDVGQLELATRDQMPRMRGCFGCHQMSDSAARGTAKSDCLVCHVATTATQGAGSPVDFAETVENGAANAKFGEGSELRVLGAVEAFVGFE